eukprot:682568-Amphidinium_carterae.2
MKCQSDKLKGKGEEYLLWHWPAACWRLCVSYTDHRRQGVCIIIASRTGSELTMGGESHCRQFPSSFRVGSDSETSRASDQAAC